MSDMELVYKRSGGSNYLILPAKDEMSGYEEGMLSQNEVRALLSFHTVCMDGKRELWYDITGRQSLRDIAEREGLSVMSIRELLESIGDAYGVLGEYLLEDEQIYVTPETIFVKKDGGGMEASFCFYPHRGESRQEQLCRLAEFFVMETPQEDEALSGACYHLYEEAMRGDVTVASLLAVLDSTQHRATELCAKEIEIPKEIEPERTKTVWESEEDETGEQDEEGILDRICQFFLELPQKLLTLLRKKKEDYFPPKDLEEDLVYDPTRDYDEPTVLLTEDKDSCIGKLLYEGDAGEGDYQIDKDTFSIGTSNTGNDAVLHATVVSHFHARITRSDGRYYVEDLNSTNGTYLNGEALLLHRKYELKYMDKIHFANVAYRIV